MNDFYRFCEAYGFRDNEGFFVGRYNDMHIILQETPRTLTAWVYLNVPKGARYDELMRGIAEKQERYRMTVKQNANRNVLEFAFENASDAASRMERCLDECDGLLRPYGREMGVLCAKCRSEIHEEDAYEIRFIDGLPLPVCMNCENGNTFVRRENRDTQRQKRVRGGVKGALAGMGVCTALWGVISMLGLSYSWIPAIGVGFLMNVFYERAGGMEDKWRNVLLSVCAVFAIVLGSMLGLVLSILVQVVKMPEFAQVLTASYVISSVVRYPFNLSFWTSNAFSMVLAVISVFVLHKRR